MHVYCKLSCLNKSFEMKGALTLRFPLQVEEHNGHIFKSTQYSIPTYCEYCSSLIWMMDRACVCKREDVTKDTNTHTFFCRHIARLCFMPLLPIFTVNQYLYVVGYGDVFFFDCTFTCLYFAFLNSL